MARLGRGVVNRQHQFAPLVSAPVVTTVVAKQFQSYSTEAVMTKATMRRRVLSMRSEPASWLFHVVPSAGVLGHVGDEFQQSLNRLAGTSGLDAQAAANVWAGTTGRDLIGALNVKAGTLGLDLNAVVQKITGSTLDAQGALAGYHT